MIFRHEVFYKEAAQSLLENPAWKIILGGLAALFHVPIQFLLAMPIFWALDFWSGLYASKKKAKKEGKKKWLSVEMMRKQFSKITVHLGFLIGCVVAANAFGVEEFKVFGFGWIIGTEFVASTVPNFFGHEKAGQITKQLKQMFFKSIGIKINIPTDDKSAIDKQKENKKKEDNE